MEEMNHENPFRYTYMTDKRQQILMYLNVSKGHKPENFEQLFNNVEKTDKHIYLSLSRKQIKRTDGHRLRATATGVISQQASTKTSP